MQIYVGREGNQQGPYSLEQIQQYLAQGGLQLTDSAWYEGLGTQWIPLSEVPGVVVAQPQVPPPLPKGALQQSREEYGGFWVRVGAMLIDGLWIIPIVFFFDYLDYSTYPAGTWESYAEYWETPSTFVEGDGLWAFCMEWLVAFVPLNFISIVAELCEAAICIAFWSIKSATPGKMVFGLKIVDAKTGNKPSLGQFVGRYFAWYLSAIPFCLGYFWVAWDKRKQGFHDHLAGTVVIKT